MLIYRSINKVNKLFFDWDLLDKDIEFIIDKKKAIQESKFYSVIVNKVLEAGEVHVDITNKDYTWYKIKPEFLWKIKDGEWFSIEYTWDWYELAWWTLKVNVIWDYEEWWDEIMTYAGESLIDDMTYIVYKNIFSKSVIKKVVYEFSDKKIWTYKMVDWFIVDIIWTESNNVSENWIIKDSNKYYQDILKAEWKQGYWNTRELMYNEWWQTVPVKLWHDQKIILDWQEQTLYDMYTPQVRLAMLKWVYSDEQIAKAQIDWSLKTLQHWQYDVVKDFWHVNVVAAVRRSWKGRYELGYTLTEEKWLIQMKDIEVGMHVMWSDYKWTKVINKWTEEEDAIKVTFKNGTEHITTLAHPMPTANNYNPITDKWDYERDSYTPAAYLKKWDFVPVMNWYECIDESEYSYKDWFLLWTVFWDWTVNRKNIIQQITLWEDKLLSFIKVYWDDITIKSYWNYSIIRLKNKISEEYISYKPDWYWRRVPSNLYKLANKYRYAFLWWLILTDWYIWIMNKHKHKDWYNRKRWISIEYVNKDKEFIEQLWILLSSLWITYRVRTRFMQTNFNEEWSDYYYLYIEWAESVKNLLDNCWKYLSHKKNYSTAKEILEDFDSTVVNSNSDKIPLCFRKKYWSKIVKEQWYNWNMFWWIKKNRSNWTAPHYNFQRWKASYYYLENTLKYKWLEVEKVELIWKRNIVHLEVDNPDSLYFEWDILWHNSFLSALLAVRELLKENYSPKPTRILYYGLSVWKTKTVIDYLLALTKDFRKFKMFQRRQSERTLSFIDPDTKDTIWSIEFHSAQEDEAWVGEYADMIIIDEAARFPEYVYDAMKAIIFSEWAKAFIISTIWWDTSKNWFYQELLKAEKENIKRKWSIAEYEYKTDNVIKKVNEHWYDYFLKNRWDIYEELNRAIFEHKRYVAWRVTIDEVDRMPDYKKKALIDEIRSNPLRYFTEVYCIYPSENKVFNYESGLTELDKEEVLHKKKYQKIYVWYDPALTSDNAGITSVWVYRDDLWKLRFEIFDSIFIDPNRWMRYQEQVQFVTKIIRNYKTVCPDTYLCVDAWWVGIAVMENFKDQTIDFPIKSIWNWVLHRERWVWIAPKELMVITLKNLFDEWYVKTNKTLKDLLAEIDYFKKKTTAAGNNKYEAEVWHDDLVTSMMIAIFSAFEIDSLKNELNSDSSKWNDIAWITFEQLSKFKQDEKEQQQYNQNIKSSNSYMSKFWF